MYIIIYNDDIYVTEFLIFLIFNFYSDFSDFSYCRYIDARNIAGISNQTINSRQQMCSETLR